MTGFARPFKVAQVEGIPPGEVLHGVQFPDGRCVVALWWGGFNVSDSFEHLPLPEGAVVEWQDGGQP